MKLFKWFKVNGENREFMYLHGAATKQEILDFLKRTKYFTLWDARE